MTAPLSRPGSGTVRCGVEEGAFISFRGRAIDATRHHSFPSAVQIAINIVLAGWGYTEMTKSKTK